MYFCDVIYVYLYIHIFILLQRFRGVLLVLVTLFWKPQLLRHLHILSLTTTKIGHKLKTYVKLISYYLTSGRSYSMVSVLFNCKKIIIIREGLLVWMLESPGRLNAFTTAVLTGVHSKSRGVWFHRGGNEEGSLDRSHNYHSRTDRCHAQTKTEASVTTPRAIGADNSFTTVSTPLFYV